MDLIVRFTGVCLYDRHAPKKHGSVARVSVILPHADMTSNDVDGQGDAVPHHAYLVARANCTFNDNPVIADTSRLMRLQGAELSFDIAPKPKGKVDVSHMNDLVSLTDIAQDVSLRGDLHPFASNGRTAAWVDITHGAITTRATDPNRYRWSFEKHLHPSPPKLDRIALEVFWRVTGVTNVNVRVARRVGDAIENTLVPAEPDPDTGDVCVVIANLEPDPDDPTVWPHWHPEQPCKAGALDDDFRWLYRALESTTPKTLRKRLGGKKAPAPVMECVGGGTTRIATGPTCMGAEWP